MYIMKINSIQTKILILLSAFAFITSSINFLFFNLFVNNFKEGPRPFENVENIILNPALTPWEIREQIRLERESYQQSIVYLSVISVMVQFFVFAFGAYLILKKSFTPLEELNKTIKEINDLNLKAKIIATSSTDEIGQLVENFNKMIERIQNLIDKEKEFIHNITHEIKTPLSAVRANIESLGILNADIDKEHIKEVLNSVDSLNNLIDDLLLISQIEKKPVFTEKFLIVDRIKKIIGFYSKKVVRIEFNPGKEFFTVLVKGSETLFDRAIQNIIDNSIKYVSTFPEVLILLKKIGDQLQITITDNGAGILAEESENIFVRFYRIEKSRSKKTGGRGLGLSITKEIINLMGGEIRLDTQNLRGSSFCITLPFYKE